MKNLTLLLPAFIHKKTYLIVLVCLLSGLVLLAGCMSYYTRNNKFNVAFEQGNLGQAAQILLHDKKAAKRKTQLLYFLNMGTVLSLDGKYKESNIFFEKAYIAGESLRKETAEQILAAFTNPTALPYTGEDHELLLLYYYKAINFLKMGDLEGALVECKRMNIRLNQLSDRYKSDNRYKRDAFVHLLMGIIYEANNDFNNAFIAYRNSQEIYSTDYQKLFGMRVPLQLEQDLIRSAYLAGFGQDGRRYEKKFNQKYRPRGKNEGDIIYFWNNGLGPVKAETSLNFNIVPGQGSEMYFVNEEAALRFPVVYTSNQNESQAKLTDLKIVRVAFPKYVERRPVWSGANISANGIKTELELAEPVNQIAFKCLEQRMGLEIGKAIMRLALKQAAQFAIKKGVEAGVNSQNNNSPNSKQTEQQRAEQERKKANAAQAGELAGFAVGLFNAMSEKADTRNWQTIPHQICYGRLRLEAGEHQLSFVPRPVSGAGIALNGFNRPNQIQNVQNVASAPQAMQANISVNISPGQQVFVSYSSLDYFR